MPIYGYRAADASGKEQRGTLSAESPEKVAIALRKEKLTPISIAEQNAMVDSKDAAAAVIVQLRSFESLSDVAVGAISETEDENGIVQVNFAVTCSYPAPAADETAAAATTATATEPAAAPKN